MSPEEIDAALNIWRERLDCANQNLLALNDDIALQRIEGRDGFAKLNLTGATAERVLPAVETMRRLFSQANTLTDVIDRADSLRKRLRSRPWTSGETRDEITRLLTGPAIATPAVALPLAHRSLLSGATSGPSGMTLDDMLGAMTASFDEAKSAVLAVDAAWAEQEPKLDAALTKANALVQRASALGIAPPAQLRAAGERIAALRGQMLSDPLGVGAAFDRELGPLLETARAQLEGLERQRDQMTAELTAARLAPAKLRAALDDSARAYEQARAAICSTTGAPFPPPAVDPATLVRLDEWLSTLDAAYHGGHWDAVRVGLRNFRESVAALLDPATAATAANRAALDRLAEVTGRLAIVEGRLFRQPAASGDTAPLLALQARTLLASPPVPLDRVAKLVEACESRLRQKAAAS